MTMFFFAFLFASHLMLPILPPSLPPSLVLQVISFFLEPTKLTSSPILHLLLSVLQTPEAEDLRSLFLSSPSLHALLTIAFGMDGSMLPGREAGKEDWPLLKPQKEGWTVEKLKEERTKVDTGVLTHHGLLLLTNLLRMESESGGEGRLLATRNTPVMQALRYLWSLHRPSASSSSSTTTYYGAPSTHPPSVLDIPHTRAQADEVLILECLLIYSKGHPTDSEGLLSLLEVFTRPTFTGTEGGK
jgi:hypothetical protein